LNCQTLQFNSYNVPQLQEILEKRVEQAFKLGTVLDEVVDKIAEQVAENSGDCREALEKLLRAGRRTDRSRENEVSIPER
jgi:cell division control protein 6